MQLCFVKLGTASGVGNICRISGQLWWFARLLCIASQRDEPSLANPVDCAHLCLCVCVCDSLIYDRFICCCGRRAERGKCSRPDGGSTPSRSVSRLDRGGRGGGAPTSSPSRKSSPTCLTWSRQTARRPADSTLPRARPRRALTADKSNYISARKFAAFSSGL